MKKQMNRVKVSLRALRNYFDEPVNLVKIGQKNMAMANLDDSRSTILWNFASVSKNRHGVYSFGLSFDFLADFDLQNNGFNGKKIYFAASLFNGGKHAIALFDWQELFKYLYEKASHKMNFNVVRKGGKPFYIQSKRPKLKLASLSQSNWVRVQSRNKSVAIV